MLGVKPAMVAHSIDLPLIAERVETEGELHVIREMGIQGVQGQLFGQPAPCLTQILRIRSTRSRHH
jgi:EAL domain-containing protein (putative c-di-GMP-specific phosphodiesterase class I)